jgi:malonate-semialdehyde dehydrogenase (acetylating)/methylmalonate-semialdehyde dehydrogenase
METIHHYIAGSLTEGSAAAHQPVFNPATGETPSQVVLGDASDVQAAVDAAKAALPDWAKTPTLRRSRILDRFKTHPVGARRRTGTSHLRRARQDP